PVESGSFDVAAGGTAIVPDLAGPDAHELKFHIQDASGAPLAGKLVVKATSGADPDFGDLHVYAVSHNVAYAADGNGTVMLGTGTYDVYAAHGFTWQLGHE